MGAITGASDPTWPHFFPSHFVRFTDLTILF